MEFDKAEGCSAIEATGAVEVEEAEGCPTGGTTGAVERGPRGSLSQDRAEDCRAAWASGAVVSDKAEVVCAVGATAAGESGEADGCGAAGVVQTVGCHAMVARGAVESDTVEAAVQRKP